MSGMDLVGYEESDLSDNTPWSFRFSRELKAAIAAAADASGISRAEWVARACCNEAGIEYVPSPPGRRWPEPEPKPVKTPKRKRS